MNKKGMDLNKKGLDDLKGTVDRYFSNLLIFLILDNIMGIEE